MVKLGYHCSMEQFSPHQMLQYAIEAEKAGFKHLSCSDHFAPWSNSQGHSGNAWCWMGAVLASTKMTCGTVCCPGYRYNPAIVAQMAATLGHMFPSRLWVALGSGEYLNEHIATTSWPEKETRNEILKECAEIIQQLLAGREVSSSSEHVKVNAAKLYTLPEEKVPILGAALSEKTAAYLGAFTDGLITVGSFEKVKGNVKAYRKQAGNQKKLVLKLDVSYAKTKDQAAELGWKEWRYTQLNLPLLSDLRFPAEFEKAAEVVTQEEFAKKVILATSPADLKAKIDQFAELGFEQINVHNVNKDQSAFIDAFSQII